MLPNRSRGLFGFESAIDYQTAQPRPGKYLPTQWGVKHEKSVSSWKQGKLKLNYLREKSYASLVRRADTTNEDNKYRTLQEKLIQLEVNDWSKFQEHQKKYTRPDFNKHQRSNRLVMGRDPML